MALNLVFAVSGYIVLGAGLIAWYYFLWMGWDVLGAWQGFSIDKWANFSTDAGQYYMAWAAIGILFALTWARGPRLLNGLSLSRLYEQRIQRTWLIVATPGRKEEVEKIDPKQGWTRTWVRPDIRVSELKKAAASPTSPYHLICTSLNIPGSTGPKLLDREADSFVIAPEFSGSALTKWESTQSLPTLDKMSLARAATISAAAVSPNMGMYTNPTLSILTTLFNVRLGSWISNPRPSWWFRRWFWPPPPFLY